MDAAGIGGDEPLRRDAGSRESGPDVKVYASQWNNGKWGEPWVVASRDTLGKALGHGVRRIGNPVAWTGPDGRIHLYVVATGWIIYLMLHSLPVPQVGYSP